MFCLECTSLGTGQHCRSTEPDLFSAAAACGSSGMLCQQYSVMSRLLQNASTRRVFWCVRQQPVRSCPRPCSSQRKCAAYATQRVDTRLHQRTQATATKAPTSQPRHTNGLHSDTTHPRPLTFQAAITALEKYWAEQSGLDCAILLPHNTEVKTRNCSQHW